MNLRQLIDESIREHGWFVQNVQHGEDEAGEVQPPFSYSIGLVEGFGHPEIMVIGFSHELMHELINIVGSLVRNEERFTDWGRSSA